MKKKKFFIYKSNTFKKIKVFIDMGRKSIKKEQQKVKFGISLDPILYKKMIEGKINKSRLIEKLLKQYYGNEDM